MNLRHLMDEIERVLPDGGEWCSLEKAQTMASLVIGLRPATIVEIGVWMGGSLIPTLLAVKHLGAGHVIAIDPWSPDASLIGETPENIQWWGATDHNLGYKRFMERVVQHEVESYCEVWRKRSDDCTPPDVIDLLHIDGNHADQAVRDVERFCPHVRIGGIAILDDVNWVGGHVTHGVELARAMGFVDMYPLGTGLVMQRGVK